MTEKAIETTEAGPGFRRVRSTPPPEDWPREGLYEVLTRRPDGHESVHRLRAKDPETATEHVLALGIDPAEVVEVRKVS